MINEGRRTYEFLRCLPVQSSFHQLVSGSFIRYLKLLTMSRALILYTLGISAVYYPLFGLIAGILPARRVFRVIFPTISSVERVVAGLNHRISVSGTITLTIFTLQAGPVSYEGSRSHCDWLQIGSYHLYS